MDVGNNTFKNDNIILSCFYFEIYELMTKSIYL